MIKRYFSIVIIAVIAKFSCLAQIQHDYNWILGYPPNNSDEFFGGVMLDFNENLISPHFFDIFYSSREAGIISDKNGNLIGYSNGCVIVDSTHQLMTNGDSINYGYVWDGNCSLGYPGTQDKLILPWPDDTNKFLLLHIRMRDDYSEYDVLYSVFETNQENPNGIVLSKNKHLLSPGSTALLTATRHANGRDWWIVIPEGESNGFFTLLFDPFGISIMDTTYIGTAWGPREWASQAVFTPDGTKYIRNNPWKGVDIFDFDRCSGKLSNAIESGPLVDPANFGSGVGVSLNSQFLYVSNVVDLYQYDLQSSDILNSRILIDTFDGYNNPFATTFYQMMLAPDGKIYMFANNGVKSIHVIHEPNKLGIDCNFVQHGIELPAYVFIGSPNIPYFRLGPEDGGTCDTLSINNTPIADFRYYPDSLNKSTVSFTNLSYFNPEVFEWDFGNGQSSALKDPGHIDYTIPGNYEACLTVSNIYGSHTFCRSITFFDSTTSLLQPQHKEIEVFPNPFSSIIHLHNIPFDMKGAFTLYNVLGEIMFSSALDGSQNQTLNVENVKEGFYYYSITKENKILSSGSLAKFRTE